MWAKQNHGFKMHYKITKFYDKFIIIMKEIGYYNIFSPDLKKIQIFENRNFE